MQLNWLFLTRSQHDVARIFTAPAVREVNRGTLLARRCLQLIMIQYLCWFAALLMLVATSSSCSRHDSATGAQPSRPPKQQLAQAPVNIVPVIHVFVALADNVNQGIVPVSSLLGDGDNPKTNLYWGAAFGVKTFFSKNRDWQLLSVVQHPRASVLERCIFKHRARALFLVADAYQGKEIQHATSEFLQSLAGEPGEKITAGESEFNLQGSADLIAYVGHDGLMDFQLSNAFRQRDTRQREAIILACASKQFFSQPLKPTGAQPLLWTTNLMAPEAYVLSAAVDGWTAKETGEQIQERAARAYDKYQHCGLRSARALFATGF
jgi:hypothetical protein